MSKHNEFYLIDDDSIFLVIAKNMITKFCRDATVTCFKNAEEAIDALRNLGQGPFPDLLMLDINMPKMDGWEFLESFEQHGFPCTPICIASSTIDPKDRLKAVSHPSVRLFIEKPLTKGNIKDIIQLASA